MTNDEKTCSVDGCGRHTHCRFLCTKHYQRWKKHGDPLHYAWSRSPEDRFWAFVNKTDSCWLWTGASNPQGYGLFSLNGKLITAASFSYFLAQNEWPKPECLHDCDNPPCVRPDHLHAGTRQQNMIERFERRPGNIPRGESSGAAVLTEQDVLSIRERWTQLPRGFISNGGTGSITALAKAFNCSRAAIDAIVKRRTWRHL